MYKFTRTIHTAVVAASILCLQNTTSAQKPAPITPSIAPENPSATPKDRLGESWWAARHKAIVDSLPSHADTQLLLIGDSITNNYDKADPPNQNFLPTWQHYYAPRKALNLGFSGDTTANVLWRLDHGEVEGLHPKAVVLLIGTNNTAYGQTVQQTEAGIDAVIVDLEYRLPNTKILLMAILPTALPSMDKDMEINSYLATRYAGRHDPQVSFIDIGVIFYNGGSLADAYFYDPTLTPSRPALHPNTLGQRRMASAIEPMLARLMEDTPVMPAE